MVHTIIYVPGLADKIHYTFGQRTALFLWRSSRVRPYYFVVDWVNKHESFERKLERLIQTIDHAKRQGQTISLVTCSAGSSLTLAAYVKRRAVIKSVVSICGKLYHPETVPRALYELNPAFKTALLRYPKVESELTNADRKKVLVVRAAHDSYVPQHDGHIAGAHITTIPSVGHVFSIMMALTIFRRRIIRFIQR
jgi:hypothetical protein